MKIAALPFCAVAFAALSIAHVALAHFNVIALSPAWLVLTSYSAVIAAAVWADRRVQQQPLINYGGAHGIALGRSPAHWDGFAPDAGLVTQSVDLGHSVIWGEGSQGMTTAINLTEKS